MPRLLGIALRRVRLLTVLALVAVPWLILSYDITWRDTPIMAGILVLLAAGAFAFITLARRGGRTGE